MARASGRCGCPMPTSRGERGAGRGVGRNTTGAVRRGLRAEIRTIARFKWELGGRVHLRQEEHRPIQSSGRALSKRGDHRRRSLDATSPHSNRCRVAFPTLRPPRLWLFGGTGAVDEAWKTHRRCRFGRGRERPDRVSRAIVRSRPQGGTKADPLDQWHGGDGVVHALSTATIPSQSSRGGQGVGNPLDDLGRWPSRGLRDAARTDTSPHSIGPGART